MTENNAQNSAQDKNSPPDYQRAIDQLRRQLFQQGFVAGFLTGCFFVVGILVAFLFVIG